MRVLLTGASGLVGSALIPSLEKAGAHVVPLLRSKPRGGMPFWDPQAGIIDQALLEDFDVVVHLAGENLSSGRWTNAHIARIRDSRVEGTRLLCNALASLKRPPKTLISASAIGYYGHRGDTLLDEFSPPGDTFLAKVCIDWEAATDSARESGIRVVNVRIGVVLSGEGGALQKMLPPFKLGLGGVLGDGTAYMSWIALPDLVSVIHHCIDTPEIEGPVNALTPNPVTNREFTQALAKVLHRPAILPAPAFAIRLLFGRMADEMLFASVRAMPKRLLESGFQFQHPEIEQALQKALH
jgi:uncharacterized protein